MKRILVTMLLSITAVISARAQWVRTAGPEGGHFTTMAVTSSAILASTWNGEIYRWEEGSGWTHVSNLYRPTIHAVGDGFVATSADTLYRSTDRGTSWIPMSRVGSQLTLAIDGTTIYSVEGNTIFRSHDQGANWERLASVEVAQIGMLWVHDTVMIAASAWMPEMIRSTDGGATWSRAGTGLPQVLVPYQFYSEGSTIYLSAAQFGIFRSTDNGANWIEMNDGLPNSFGNYTGMVDMVIHDGRILGSNGMELYEFDGASWRWLSGEAQVILEQRGSLIYKGARSGVERSSDRGATWTSLNGGLRAVNIGAFALSGEAIVAGGPDGIYRSVDGGMEWELASSTSVDEFVNAGPVLLARGWRIARDGQQAGAGIISSTDDGRTWSNGGSGITEDLDHISTIATNGTTVFAGFWDVFGFHGSSHWESGGIFRSTDNGTTWSAASSGLPSDGFSTAPIIDIVANDRVVLATTLAGLYRSTDNGTTWKKITSAPTYDEGLGIMVDDGEAIYLASKNRVMISTDDGLTWMPSVTGLEEFAYIKSMQIIGENLIIFVNESTAPNQVLRYDGTTWTRINSELPEGVIFNTFMIAGHHMLGGTARNSVWRLSIGGSSVAESPVAPAAVTVEPNPFGEATTIGFTLRTRADVRLEVIDLLGRNVATVQNGPLGAGAHMLTLDAADLPAGRYLYRLDIDGVRTSGALVKW